MRHSVSKPVSIIPFYGSINQADYHFSRGENGWGFAYWALATSDVFLIRSLVMGGARLGLRGFASLSARESTEQAICRAKPMKVPNVDPTLAGSNTLGHTLPDGTVLLKPGLSRAEQLSTLRHESVHAFFSPRGGSSLTAFRQWLGNAGYHRSALLQAFEEILAEAFASGSFRQGWSHAFNGRYYTPLYTVTPWTAGAELAVYIGGIGGGIYLGDRIIDLFNSKDR